MNLQQLLLNALEEWSRISGLAFTLLAADGTPVTPGDSHKLPTAEKLEAFLQSEALCLGSSSRQLYKIIHNEVLEYLLLVWGGDAAARTIGELAVYQLCSILASGKEKLNKNSYMQNILQNRYSAAEIYTNAKKLRIEHAAERAVLLIESTPRTEADSIKAVKSLLSSRTGDYVTSFEDGYIVVVRELQTPNTYEDLANTAQILVELLNTEVMVTARVAYSAVSKELSDLPTAYVQARTALEVGAIFYPDQNTFGFQNLGIGHLIYQLPPETCQRFLAETFKDASLDSLDAEMLTTIRIFFQNNLNLSETSRQLYVHRNTLVYRFEKIQKKFGLDIRTFSDALTFQIALMVSSYIKFKQDK
ncbi:MAG: PucR family transcriptional regulator [Lachnospiraceae bacterium]